MSRVEAKIKLGSKVIWSATQSGSYPSPWVAHVVLSGMVHQLDLNTAFVTNVSIHSVDLQSEGGIGIETNIRFSSQGHVELSRLKSLDDVRYKK